MAITGFLGTSGYVSQPERFSFADRMKAVGANTGNLMFQLAAARLIGGEHRHIGFANLGYGDPAAFRGQTHFVFPAANHLRVGADWTPLAGFLRKRTVPVVVLGLGAQAATGATVTDTVALLRQDSNIMEFVAVLRENAALITVRGAFSEAVCAELGLENVVCTGCPSLMLSPHADLGARMARKLGEVVAAERVDAVVTAACPRDLNDLTRTVERRLFAWLARHGGAYIQQSGEEPYVALSQHQSLDMDLSALGEVRKQIAPDMASDAFGYIFARTTALYFDARAWIADLEGRDVALGARLHGNMAALAAGIPGIVIPIDARTSELVEGMCLPTLAPADILAAGSLIEALGRVSFDPVAFDRSRLGKAVTLNAAFERIGLTPSEHLLTLAARGREMGLPAV